MSSQLDSKAQTKKLQPVVKSNKTSNIISQKSLQNAANFENRNFQTHVCNKNGSDYKFMQDNFGKNLNRGHTSHSYQIQNRDTTASIVQSSSSGVQSEQNCASDSNDSALDNKLYKIKSQYGKNPNFYANQCHVYDLQKTTSNNNIPAHMYKPLPLKSKETTDTQHFNAPANLQFPNFENLANVNYSNKTQNTDSQTPSIAVPTLQKFDQMTIDMRNALSLDIINQFTQSQSINHKNLNDQHAKFTEDMREMNCTLKCANDEIVRLKKENDTKDNIINRLITAIQTQKKETLAIKAITKWRDHIKDSKIEKLQTKIATRHKDQQLIKKTISNWKDAAHNQFTERVKQNCQNRAEQVCKLLQDKHDQKISLLENKIQDLEQDNDYLRQKNAEFQSEMKEAFMRGVCALNLEAMKVLSPRTSATPPNFEKICEQSQNPAIPKPSAGYGYKSDEQNVQNCTLDKNTQHANLQSSPIKIPTVTGLVSSSNSLSNGRNNGDGRSASPVQIKVPEATTTTYIRDSDNFALNSTTNKNVTTYKSQPTKYASTKYKSSKNQKPAKSLAKSKNYKFKSSSNSLFTNSIKNNSAGMILQSKPVFRVEKHQHNHKNIKSAANAMLSNNKDLIQNSSTGPNSSPSYSGSSSNSNGGSRGDHGELAKSQKYNLQKMNSLRTRKSSDFNINEF